MKKLALWASRYGSPHPAQSGRVASSLFGIIVSATMLAVFTIVLVSAAFAQGTAPGVGGLFSSITSLYGPACGLLVALVILCERIARVIPNSTDNRILKALLAITSILGVKVPDNK